MVNRSGSPELAAAGASHVWPVFRSLNGYRIQFFSHDLVAGLTLAAIAIPEQMATARLGGFRPYVPFHVKATRPRCDDEGCPDRPGRASHKGASHGASY